MAISLVLFIGVARHAGVEQGGSREFFNFVWLTSGTAELRLGLLLDPLSAAMGAMVTFVGLLIFIFSLGYMKEDRNFARFFCFLSLFSGAMLGVVFSNSLLLTFICWELVGLASYLLIGFWFHKPEAAAAAKKAFLTTRVGDIAFLIGMLWLSSRAGTLLFFSNGGGCLETTGLRALHAHYFDLALPGIALLIFIGAMGKSGQFPLHVWLPDAMEGPTPVSALIHAATMVAAGVFLVARMFPLFIEGGAYYSLLALHTVAWVGAFTALFAACIAVAQTDIKRILAYSTVSQLGFMMLALGVGSVGVAMLHLIAHAFFKALLFLGAGSVIHGVHEEQDIRHMGGLRKFMPVTFATYAIGMMALSGVPFFFSGFWSKDAILHAALHAHCYGPFGMAAVAALLTAFYMTRQMAYVFFGEYRGHAHPHESPRVMTVPLMILAAAAILLSIPATPAWPWLESFIAGEPVKLEMGALFDAGFLGVVALSMAIVTIGIGAAFLMYRKIGASGGMKSGEIADPLQGPMPGVYQALANRLYVDEIYRDTVVRAFTASGWFFAWVDRWIFKRAIDEAGRLSALVSRLGNGIDRNLINFGFDNSCNALQETGAYAAGWQGGRVQGYLRVIGVGMVVLLVIIGWCMA